MKSLPNEIFSIRLVMAIAVSHSYLINKCHSRATGNETLLLHVKEPWATYCEWRWKRKLMTKRKLKKKKYISYTSKKYLLGFLSVFSESLNGLTRAPYPFGWDFLCSLRTLHRQRLTGKKQPLLRRGLPRPQVVDKERYGIHSFALSREGGVFENLVE